MAGQLMVRVVEAADDDEDAHEDDAASAASAADVEPVRARARAILRATPPTFLSLPYEEALAFFESLEVVSIDEFRAIQDRFREGAWSAALIESQHLRELAKKRIGEALAGNMTVRETAAAIRNDQIALGVSPNSHDYLDLVARNAVATAYGHGKWVAANDPAIRAARPFWQYLTVNDGRVRPNHRALHERVFRIGTEEHALYFPPLGHRCRCSGRTLSPSQMERWGLTVTEGVIEGVMPDPGWEAPPRPTSTE